MFGLEDKQQEREISKQIAENQQLYQRVFDSIDGKQVLVDLEKRCFINQTTYDIDEKKMGLNEGRRSIYVYIKNIMNRDLKEMLEELTRGN